MLLASSFLIFYRPTVQVEKSEAYISFLQEYWRLIIPLLVRFQGIDNNFISVKAVCEMIGIPYVAQRLYVPSHVPPINRGFFEY